MRKYVITTILAAGLSCVVNAQQEPALSGISFATGASIPVGAFSASGLFEESPGYAQTGISASLSYSRRFSKKWVGLLQLQARRHTINVSDYRSAYGGAYLNPIFTPAPTPVPPPSQDFVIYNDWKFKQSSWLSLALLGGVEYQVATGPAHAPVYYARLSAGAVMARSPHLSGESITDTSLAAIERKPRTGWGLAWSAETGFYFPLSSRISLSTGIAFAGTNQVAFKNSVTKMGTARGQAGFPGYTVSQSSMTATEKQTMNSICLQLGVLWQLR